MRASTLAHGMARTHEDVETYLLTLARPFELDQGTFVVSSGPDSPPIAIRVEAPVVAVRVDIGAVPADTASHIELFRKLLELNASDLLHAAYGISHGHIVLSAGLELENLDVNELDATLSDIDLALARHVPALRAIARGI